MHDFFACIVQVYTALTDKRLHKQAVFHWMRSGRTPTASSMSSLDDLHWFRIEGLAPEVTGNDIVSYFQSARCGSGLVKKLMYLDQQKTAAEIGIERIDADGW